MFEEHEPLVEMVSALAAEVRGAVRPLLGSASAKGTAGSGATGDTTFAIDEVAERVIESFLSACGDVAYYTEDRGLVVLGRPSHLLVIDPIDGTRPAAAGLEACCVSVAVAPFHPPADRSPGDGTPTGVGSLNLGDVFLGLMSELKNDATYLAVKGMGARIEVDGTPISPRLSPTTEINTIFWTAGFRGRPAEPLVTVIGDLIDLTSVDGGCFDLGSATFCIARVLTGEMDAYVDVGQRMVEEVDAVKPVFERVGHGAILNNYPYDLAAAALIASESGATVTDAYGGPLWNRPLVPPEGGGQLSSLVASNAELHGLLLAEIGLGMKRLAARYGGG